MITRVLLGIAAAAALIGLAGCACRATTPALSKDMERTIRAQLTKDCGTGDPADSLGIALIRRAGRGSYPVLWSALRLGPTDAELDTVRETAVRSFARIQRFRQKSGFSSWSQSDLVRAAGLLDQPAYVSLEVRSFAYAYRERALNALIALRAPGHRDSLRAIARDSTLAPEIRNMAEAALRRK